MHVAITGASGLIGSVTAHRLKQAGHTVCALIRQTSRRDHIESVCDRIIVADQADRSAWPEFLDGADVVVHNSVDWDTLKNDRDAHLESNLLGSLRLLEASSPRQFIFVSSVAVHHDIHPTRFDADGIGIIEEFHITRPGSWYGAYKAAVEAHMWAAFYEKNRACTAIRPAAVYGIDPKLSRTIGYPFFEQVASGKPFARSGGGKFIHVDDVARGILGAIDNRKAFGRTFTLADCYARWCDWASICCELAGKSVEIDESSPSSPKNMFDAAPLVDLGLEQTRGPDGIRAHLVELFELMRRNDLI